MFGEFRHFGFNTKSCTWPKELQDLLENFCLICFVLLQRYLNNKRPELLARPQARLRPTTKEEDSCVCKTSCATVGHDILNNLTKVWEGGGVALYIACTCTDMYTYIHTHISPFKPITLLNLLNYAQISRYRCLMPSLRTLACSPKDKPKLPTKMLGVLTGSVFNQGFLKLILFKKGLQ